MTLDPEVDDVVEAVRDHTRGGATSAIETTAIADVLLQALDCLGARGTCVALGVGMPEFAFGMERLGRGKSLRTTIEGDSDPHELIPRLLQLHARGELPVEKLIRTYRFCRLRPGAARCRVRRDDQAGAGPLAPRPLRPALL